MKSTILFFKNMTVGKTILLSLSSLLITILDMKTTLLALAIIICIDMLTGIRKNLHLKNIKIAFHKKEFWHAIKSSGLRSTWRKTCEYGIGIIVFSVLDSMVLKNPSIALMGENYSLAELAVIIACLVESYSVYENMEAVSGNNLFKKVLGLMPQRFKSIFQSKTKKQ